MELEFPRSCESASIAAAAFSGLTEWSDHEVGSTAIWNTVPSPSAILLAIEIRSLPLLVYAELSGSS